MKSSPSIWHYVVSVKSTVKISSIFVAFLENKNFNWNSYLLTNPKQGADPQNWTLTQVELDLHFAHARFKIQNLFEQ